MTKPIKDKIEKTNYISKKKVNKTTYDKGEIKMSIKKVAGIIGGIAGVTMIGARSVRWRR